MVRVERFALLALFVILVPVTSFADNATVDSAGKSWVMGGEYNSLAYGPTETIAMDDNEIVITPWLVLATPQKIEFGLTIDGLYSGHCQPQVSTMYDVLLVEDTKIAFSINCSSESQALIFKPLSELGNKYLINQFEQLHKVRFQHLAEGVHWTHSATNFSDIWRVISSWKNLLHQAL
ncbi:exported hypothetical protein [Vibrio coralliirubri]|uniref:hypothetical protein n=1 Tax=Vibrio coralliirubri TaxID=1516159 RepID=UPI00063A7337|nr:hypothetical protein [Vibrio coralliirubri]CDT67742.1 exported hypothetical protein [Vibrio coralliirubri]